MAAKKYPYSDLIKGYRTYNKWADQQVVWDSQTMEYHLSSIEDYLDQPRFAGLKYKYFHTPGSKEWQKHYLVTPLREIIQYANTLMRPLYTDFTEVTENEEFMMISGKFYYELFIQEYIFVTYNVFEDGEMDFTLDGGNDKNRKLYEAIKRKGGFDLWVKLNEDEYSDNVEFMHIDTSLVVKFPQWREQMAWCRWSAVPQGNLTNWLNIAGVDMALTKFLDQCIRVTGKKLALSTRGDSKEHRDKLEEQLNSFVNYIQTDMVSNSDIEPFQSMEGADLEAIKDSIYHMLDRIKYEYGRVANTNPKGERVTSGENYKDITAIANRQKETLEYLINFAFQVERLWGIELEFCVSGIPEKEAIATEAHKAQTPNMEKEMLGQIEGTQPRPPVGQSTRTKKKSNRSVGWSH